MDDACQRMKKGLRSQLKVKSNFDFNGIMDDCIEVQGDVTGMMVSELQKLKIEKQQVVLLKKDTVSNKKSKPAAQQK